MERAGLFSLWPQGLVAICLMCPESRLLPGRHFSTHDSWAIRCHFLSVALAAAHTENWWPLTNFSVFPHTCPKFSVLVSPSLCSSSWVFQEIQIDSGILGLWTWLHSAGPGCWEPLRSPATVHTQGPGLSAQHAGTQAVFLHISLKAWDEMILYLNFSISCRILWCDVWCFALVFRFKFFSPEQN